MLEPFRHFGLVARRTGRRVFEGEDCNVVEASRAYDTSVEDLWEAVTSAERIPRWFLPISGELTLGGRYQLEGNAGGMIRACEPPRRFEVSWEFGGGVSWLEVTISPEDDGARLTLQHISPVAGMADFYAQFGPGAVGVGWDLALLGLAQHVAGAPAISREEALAWSMSEEGKALARRSADAWGEAAIAAGDEPAGARSAAARTAAFYTGAA